MGSQVSSQSTAVFDNAAPNTPSSSGCPVSQASGGGCPVAHEKTKGTAADRNAPSECPVTHAKFECSGADDINPSNMMPPPNQLPSLGQPFPLSTDRVRSNIPKGTEDSKKGDTWVYPSEQMFWNAMLRKGWRWKDETIAQKDMKDIIKIHNTNNELAWQEILFWEKSLHSGECATDCIKLKSFKGAAQKYTPRARIRQLLGYELPFDRHDWIVDRCGKEVHYVIDYYDGFMDKKSYAFANLDVRPALDSWQNWWDRCIVFYWRVRQDWLSGILPNRAPAITSAPSSTNS